jgi:hypothetical protein
MVKGKYGNRTRRRIKGGNNSPRSVKKSGTYGFGQNRSINPKPKTIWSREKYFGFTPPVGDINVDNYNDATLFEDDDNATLFDSASKKSSKKISLPKTSLPKTSFPTDIDLKYSKIMKSFIALGNNMLEQTKGELARIEKATRASDDKELHDELNAIKVIVDQWDIQNTEFNEKALNFQQIDNGKPLKIESDYLDALAFIVKNSFDYFSKVKIALNPFMKKYKDKFQNGPKKPWWMFNFTRKNKGKTGTQAIHKIQQTAKVNFNQAAKIATAIREANKPLTNKNIKSVLATLKE